MFEYSFQLELQRQQLLSDRQQFQRDQLKAAEVRSLQSPTLQPQTPLQLPPILRAPPMRSPSALKIAPTSLSVPEGGKEENVIKAAPKQDEAVAGRSVNYIHILLTLPCVPYLEETGGAGDSTVSVPTDKKDEGEQGIQTQEKKKEGGGTDVEEGMEVASGSEVVATDEASGPKDPPANTDGSASVSTGGDGTGIVGSEEGESQFAATPTVENKVEEQEEQGGEGNTMEHDKDEPQGLEAIDNLDVIVSNEGGVGKDDEAPPTSAGPVPMEEEPMQVR